MGHFLLNCLVCSLYYLHSVCLLTIVHRYAPPQMRMFNLFLNPFAPFQNHTPASGQAEPSQHTDMLLRPSWLIAISRDCRHILALWLFYFSESATGFPPLRRSMSRSSR
ncbi:hypothetical protein BJ138DRAFT_1152121 [Hygrophoropsis aurantiaca]|uniref:Uncharacterized protein n=1 Tax=Hygrophoropsis aurantiaca TaxID=72124 RepID=A0ACB8ACM0_9AGAM|nr:hypothetical protein BJ138DRAFT_1152121 [Hygrophoropsis aurantiaca]